MINSVTLVGNLGRDPEIRYNPSGTPIATFSMAVNEFWREKESNEKKSRTHWFRCVAFARTAEIVGQYLNKGSKVGIHGQLTYREWESDGQKRSTVEVRVQDLELLGANGKARTEPAEDPDTGPSTEGGDIPF